MTPPAVSQIVEQFIRVVTMVVLAYVLLATSSESSPSKAAAAPCLPDSQTAS